MTKSHKIHQTVDLFKLQLKQEVLVHFFELGLSKSLGSLVNQPSYRT